MPNNYYYERLSEMNPGELADGLAIEQEFDAIGRGFSKLPAPHRDGGGFEGPTKVGDPVEQGDAVNLSSLEKLNLPIYRKKITTENWDNITTPGIYDVVNATGQNKPPTFNYGLLQVYLFNGVATQVFYPDKNDSGVLAKRSCQNTSIGIWQAWSVLSAVNFTTIIPSSYPSSSPHDTHETVDSALPPSIVANSRYVLANPFGANVRVLCIAEIWYAGEWVVPGWDGNTGQLSGLYSVGVSASYIQGVGIRVTTGIGGLGAENPRLTGGANAIIGAGAITSAPCRVFVRKLEA